MRDTIDMAREVYGSNTEWSGAKLDRLKQLVALVRADERGRMCEQLKECSSEKPTSNEANRSEVLGESG